MRKATWLLAGLAVLTLVVGLAGCGGMNEATGTGMGTAAKPPPEPPPPPPEPVPTAEKIAFERDGQVWTMYTNGTGAIQLTSEGSNMAPCWRSDGQEICFISDRTGVNRLFVMSNDGSNQRQVSFSDRAEIHGSPHWCWTAGINRIAFGIRGGVNAAVTLAVLEMDESPLGLTEICYPAWDLRSPTWSPDGSSILYEGQVAGQAYVVAATAASTPSRVLSGLGNVHDPAWSSTGTHVAYTDNYHALWVVPVNAASGEATGAPVQVANHPDTRDYQYSLRYPTWAPDGSHVAYYLAVYQKKGGGWSFKGYEVYRVQATAGGTPQYLAAGLNPEWSPAVF